MSVESSKLKQVSRSGMIKEAARKVLFFFSLPSERDPASHSEAKSFHCERNTRESGWVGVGELSQASSDTQTAASPLAVSTGSSSPAHICGSK